MKIRQCSLILSNVDSQKEPRTDLQVVGIADKDAQSLMYKMLKGHHTRITTQWARIPARPGSEEVGQEEPRMDPLSVGIADKDPQLRSKSELLAGF